MGNSLAKGAAFAIAVAGAMSSLACESGESGSEVSQQPAVINSFNELTSAEQALFQEGLGEFTEVDTAAEGLGPLFNGASCSQCHALGGVGGGGIIRVARVACLPVDNDAHAPKSGALIHLFSTRPEIAVSTVPKNCDSTIVQRRSTALFGAGLVEAVDDSVFVTLARSQDESVRGRVAFITDPDTGKRRVGRFGWKAQHSSLRAFAGDAYLNELGVTNEIFPDEIAPGGNPELLAMMDDVPDPEASVGGIDALANFMRLLAPANGGTVSDTFDQIGCADCHVRELPVSGTMKVHGKRLTAYSDFLLHDIGTGDGIVQGAAAKSEFRTAPLWGLRFSPNLMHDGRANNVREAIEQHDGQAAASRAAFDALDLEAQTGLLEQLKAL